jgi:hypothetical protein
MNSSNAGQILEHAIRSQNVNISELSRRMKINRRTLYNWFHQDRLQMDVISAIGKVINYDFSNEFKEEFLWSGPKFVNDEHAEQSTNKDLSQESRYYWMQKYIVLLEEHAALLQTIRNSALPLIHNSDNPGNK